MKLPSSTLLGLLLGLFLAGYSVFAWAPPTAAPPGGNVAAPVNVSATAQTKTGNFTANNLTANVSFSAPFGGLWLAGNSQIDGYVGIGTPLSTLYRLWVNGPLRLTDGTQGLGKVLTSNSSGVGTWQVLPAGIGGSGTTNYLAKFLSSTSLANSQLFDNGTSVGIGTSTPGAKLDVNGNAKILGLDLVNNQIHNVATPTVASDAATRGYVDAQAGGGGVIYYQRCQWDLSKQGFSYLGSTSCVPSACAGTHTDLGTGCFGGGGAGGHNPNYPYGLDYWIFGGCQRVCLIP